MTTFRGVALTASMIATTAVGLLGATGCKGQPKAIVFVMNGGRSPTTVHIGAAPVVTIPSFEWRRFEVRESPPTVVVGEGANELRCDATGIVIANVDDLTTVSWETVGYGHSGTGGLFHEKGKRGCHLVSKSVEDTVYDFDTPTATSVAAGRGTGVYWKLSKD